MITSKFFNQCFQAYSFCHPTIHSYSNCLPIIFTKLRCFVQSNNNKKITHIKSKWDWTVAKKIRNIYLNYKNKMGKIWWPLYKKITFQPFLAKNTYFTSFSRLNRISFPALGPKLNCFPALSKIDVSEFRIFTYYHSKNFRERRKHNYPFAHF